MGILWELFQQSDIDRQQQRAEDLGARVAQLEDELATTRGILHDLIGALEKRFGEDIDRDGTVGPAKG